MKTLILIILLSINLFPQKLLSGDDELFFYQDAGWHTYKLIPLYNAVWDQDGFLRTFDKWGHSVFNPLPLTINGYIGFVTGTNGMDYISSSESSTTPVFGNSIYKVVCFNGTEEQAAFFLDTRDCGYGVPFLGYNDFTIKYLESQNKFYIVEGKGVTFNDSRFVEVTNKIVQLWNVEPIPWSGIGCYEYFWINCAGIGTTNFQSLQIIWGSNPDQANVSKYYLYRKIDNGNFTKIGEFSNQTFNYMDNSLRYTGIGSSTVSYKVTSFNGTESTPTNTAIQEYYFEFNWSNGLILTKNGTHPKLIWVPNTSFNSTHHRIYRAVSNYPANPLFLNYSLISTVSSSIFEFTDNAVTILPGYQYAYYYVVGWNGSSESSKTNYVNTPAEFHKQLVKMPSEYSLSQNFPNPFNPSTKISWQVPVGSWQTLKVYDILGNEVATLAKEYKEAGSYEVEFQSVLGNKQLANGIYFYQIHAGNFVETKKMILMK